MPRGRFFLCLYLISIATPVMAQQQRQVPGDPKAKNLNEIVCETEEVSGSRLGAKRVCATRAEWEQRRLNDRQAVEKGQTQVGRPGGG